MSNLATPIAISNHVHPKLFWSTFNSCEFVSTCKKSGYFMDFIWRCGWLKNPAIWLAENILAHTQKPKFFLIWNLCRNRANNINFIIAQTYAKFFPQIQKPLFLIRFWFIFPIFGISIFSGKSGSLTHNFMWFSSTILKFRKNWWQNPKKMPGQKDGRADTLFHRTILATPRVQKVRKRDWH